MKDVTADEGTWGLIRLRQGPPAGPPTSDPLPGPGHKARSPVKATMSLTGPGRSEGIRAGGVVSGDKDPRGLDRGCVGSQDAGPEGSEQGMLAAGTQVQEDQSGVSGQ